MQPGRDVHRDLAVGITGAQFASRVGGEEYLHGLTTGGQIFAFAQNNVKLRGERNSLTGDFTGSEWAGPCYSPDGKWLFANIFEPGITVAITGPWQAGAL